jgi:hypothetical protein
MRVYPQSAAFFNAAAGGPDFGPRHLLDSNIGSGQDLLRLKKWLDRHREASPLGVVISGNVDPRAAGIDFYLPPVGPMSQHESCSLPLAEVGPRPGWYAVEANFVYGMRRRVANGRGGWQSMPSVDCDYRYFQYFEPIAKAGYSIFIYHLEPAETNAVRQKLRMGQANRVAGGPAIAE